MAVTQIALLADLGSEEMKQVRRQLNRLTLAVQAIQDAAVTDGDTFQSNVAALTELDAFEELLFDPDIPDRPRPPANGTPV